MRKKIILANFIIIVIFVFGFVNNIPSFLIVIAVIGLLFGLSVKPKIGSIFTLIIMSVILYYLTKSMYGILYAIFIKLIVDLFTLIFLEIGTMINKKKMSVTDIYDTPTSIIRFRRSMYSKIAKTCQMTLKLNGLEDFYIDFSTNDSNIPFNKKPFILYICTNNENDNSIIRKNKRAIKKTLNKEIKTTFKVQFENQLKEENAYFQPPDNNWYLWANDYTDWKINDIDLKESNEEITSLISRMKEII